jgi:hypothetical protein
LLLIPLLAPLLVPFALIAFVLLMERVEDGLLGPRQDQDEAARIRSAPGTVEAPAPQRRGQRAAHHGDAGRLRPSSTPGGNGRTLRSGRLLAARGRAVRRSPVRPRGGVRPELRRESA